MNIFFPFVVVVIGDGVVVKHHPYFFPPSSIGSSVYSFGLFGQTRMPSVRAVGLFRRCFRSICSFFLVGLCHQFGPPIRFPADSFHRCFVVAPRRRGEERGEEGKGEVEERA